MSDERGNSGSGGAVAVVVIVVILGLLGLLAVGGLGAMFFVRSSQMSAMEARAMMEAERAHMEAQVAAVRGQEAAAKMEAVQAELEAAKLTLPPTQPATEPGPELVLEIDAAGQFILAGKTLSYEELKEALLAEHFDKGENLQLAITAAPETPFKRVNQAMECAECASITKVRIRNTALQPAAATPTEVPK